MIFVLTEYIAGLAVPTVFGMPNIVWMAQHHLDGPTIFEWPNTVWMALNVWMAQNCLDGPTLFGLPNSLKAQMFIKHVSQFKQQR